MNEKQFIRPSGWYYLLGIVVIFAGVSLFVTALFHDVRRRDCGRGHPGYCL